MTTDLSVVGKSLPRSDARIKAVGAARYCDDIIRPGMLFGKLLRSPVAHAKILNIDVSKAKKLPGVKSVITADDTLKIRFGNWRLVPESQDELPLAVDKVRFIGDEVAAVAAIDKDIAEEALSLITVEYEELPGAFSVDESLAEGAPVIHKTYSNNISLQRKIDYGDLDQGFADSHLILDNDFTVHATSHAYKIGRAHV